MHGDICILHISDLHRTNDGKIKNAGLLDSLLLDRDSYTSSEHPKIKTPDLIIVSGDIIQGSVKTSGAEKEIRRQYEEAEQFLNDLATNFLDSDIHKIIVIPGNHDIDWSCSKASMVKIESENTFDSDSKVKNHLLKGFINQNSKIRWNWDDLSFYEIINDEKYLDRLESFSTFYSAFYQGKRSYSLNPDEQFDIFDYPKFNLTIAAFNSCYNNDHLRLVGDINPECIAKASMALRSQVKEGRLILATWHHNTKGDPYDSTYMNNSRLKNFIESGIAVGFHGHQHKTELIQDYSDAIEQKKILVLSAGTLCAGPNELPAGNNRQYNLIELNWGNAANPEIDITLHVREKTDTSSFENPIWKPGRIDSALVSHITLKVLKPKPPNIDFLLSEIEELIRIRNFDEAKMRLLNLDSSDAFVRAFLLDCIIHTEDYDLALKIFQKPETDGELIVLLNAAKMTMYKSKRAEILELAKKFETSSTAIKGMIKIIEALLE